MNCYTHTPRGGSKTGKTKKPKLTREEALLPALREYLQAQIDEYHAGSAKWTPCVIVEELCKKFPRWNRKDFFWAMRRMNGEGLCCQGQGRERSWWHPTVVERPRSQERWDDIDPCMTPKMKKSRAVFTWDEDKVPRKKKFSKRLQRRVA